MMRRAVVSPMSQDMLTGDNTSDCPSSRATTCPPDSDLSLDTERGPLGVHGFEPPLRRPAVPSAVATPSRTTRDETTQNEAAHGETVPVPRVTPIAMKPATRRCLTDPLNRSGFFPALNTSMASAADTEASSAATLQRTTRTAGASTTRLSFASACPSPRAVASTHALAESPVRRPVGLAFSQTGRSLCAASSSSTALPLCPVDGPPQALSQRKICLPCGGGEDDAEDGGDWQADNEVVEESFHATEKSARAIVMAPERVHIAPLTRTYISPACSPARSLASTPRACAEQLSARSRRRSSASSASVSVSVVLDSGAVLGQTLAAMAKTLWKWLESACVRVAGLPWSPRGLGRVEQFRGPLPACLRRHVAPLEATTTTGGTVSANTERVVVKTIAVFLPTALVTLTGQSRASHGPRDEGERSSREKHRARAVTEAILRPALAVVLWHTRHLSHPGLVPLIDVYALHGALHEEKRNQLMANQTSEGGGMTTDSEDALSSGDDVLRYRVSHCLFKRYAPSACRVRLPDLAAREWCTLAATSPSSATAAATKSMCAWSLPGAHQAQSVFLMARAHVPAPMCTLDDYLRTWHTWALPPTTTSTASSSLPDTPSLSRPGAQGAVGEGVPAPQCPFAACTWATTTRFHHCVADLLWGLVEPLVYLHHIARPSPTVTGMPREMETEAKSETDTHVKRGSSSVPRVIHGNLKPSNVLLQFPPTRATTTMNAPCTPRSSDATHARRTPPTFQVRLSDRGLPMVPPSQCDPQQPPLHLVTTASTTTDVDVGVEVTVAWYRCVRPGDTRRFFTYGSHAPSARHPHASLDMSDPMLSALSGSVPYIAPECLLRTRMPRCGADDTPERLWVSSSEAWTPKADAFAVGALWFAMLTGEALPMPPCAQLDLAETSPPTTPSKPPHASVDDASLVGTPYRAVPLSCYTADVQHVVPYSDDARHEYLRGILEILVAHVFSSELVAADLLEMAADVNQLGFTGTLAQLAVALLRARFAGTREAAKVDALLQKSSPHHRHHGHTAAPPSTMTLPSCLFPYTTHTGQETAAPAAKAGLAASSGTDHLIGHALFAMLCMTERCPAAASLYEALLGLLDPWPRTRWTLKTFRRSRFAALFGTGSPECAARPDSATAAATTVRFSGKSWMTAMTDGPAFRWHDPSTQDPATATADPTQAFTMTPDGRPSAGAANGQRASWTSRSGAVLASSSPSTGSLSASLVPRLPLSCAAAFLAVTFAVKLRCRAHFARLKKACVARPKKPRRHSVNDVATASRAARHTPQRLTRPATAIGLQAAPAARRPSFADPSGDAPASITTARTPTATRRLHGGGGSGRLSKAAHARTAHPYAPLVTASSLGSGPLSSASTGHLTGSSSITSTGSRASAGRAGSARTAQSHRRHRSSLSGGGGGGGGGGDSARTSARSGSVWSSLHAAGGGRPAKTGLTTVTSTPSASLSARPSSVPLLAPPSRGVGLSTLALPSSLVRPREATHQPSSRSRFGPAAGAAVSPVSLPNSGDVGESSGGGGDGVKTSVSVPQRPRLLHR